MYLIWVFTVGTNAYWRQFEHYCGRHCEWIPREGIQIALQIESCSDQALFKSQNYCSKFFLNKLKVAWKFIEMIYHLVQKLLALLYQYCGEKLYTKLQEKWKQLQFEAFFLFSRFVTKIITGSEKQKVVGSWFIGAWWWWLVIGCGAWHLAFWFADFRFA